MTELAGIIGDPIAHSLSPAIHNAAYRSLGLDWHYSAYCVKENNIKDAIRGAAALSIRGLSVTMPHKSAAFALADEVSETAARLQSANTISIVDGRVLANTTDGQGLLDDLLDWGFIPLNRKVAVIGTGGAARAAVLTLGNSGVSEVVVLGRKEAKAKEVANLASGLGSYGLIDDIRMASDTDLFINATPVGMSGSDDLGMSKLRYLEDILTSRHWLMDMIYSPLETPLMKMASASGCKVRNGLGMLIHQAAIQFYLWTGYEAPIQIMWEAVLKNVA